MRTMSRHITEALDGGTLPYVRIITRRAGYVHVESLMLDRLSDEDLAALEAIEALRRFRG